MSTLPSIFEQNGLLDQQIKGYQHRPAQFYMARLIERALLTDARLIIEAGTGIGKTFAYLTPAFLSSQKVVISTGTKNLQDQLYQKDLPLVAKLLKTTKKTALLKGRANYLCRYRLDRSLHEGLFHSRQVIHDLHLVDNWAHQTETGDFTELATLPEDSPVFPYVTSNTDNCLGKNCPNFKHCFVLRARQLAQKADLIIVNHHLFFADLMIKEEAFGELLPETNAVIFDEAHQLPEAATHFFGHSFSSRKIHLLAQDIQAEYIKNAKEIKDLQQMKDRLEKIIKDCRLALGLETGRGSFHAIKNNPTFNASITALKEELTFVEAALEKFAIRSEGLENCHRRASELNGQLSQLTQAAPDNQIHWFETFKKHFTINLTPLQLGEDFSDKMAQYRGAWIFTSATLTSDNRFDYFQENLGLKNAHTFQLHSPFDYRNNALIYIPTNLPQANHPHYTSKMVDIILPVLKASKGRAFLLFTSFKALRETELLLNDRIDYPIFVQGNASKTMLLEQFRKTDNAILLGTQSFWEGVDVRGEALSCVIIDKLPFTSPADPLLKAKTEKLKEQGKDAFNTYQLPKAVLNLKQGVGRLIRDQNDRGVLVICDQRIIEKNYGKAFLQSLPIIPIVRNIEPVEEFYQTTD